MSLHRRLRSSSGGKVQFVVPSTVSVKHGLLGGWVSWTWVLSLGYFIIAPSTVYMDALYTVNYRTRVLDRNDTIPLRSSGGQTHFDSNRLPPNPVRSTRCGLLQNLKSILASNVLKFATRQAYHNWRMVVFKRGRFPTKDHRLNSPQFRMCEGVSYRLAITVRTDDSSIDVAVRNVGRDRPEERGLWCFSFPVCRLLSTCMLSAEAERCGRL